MPECLQCTGGAIYGGHLEDAVLQRPKIEGEDQLDEQLHEKDLCSCKLHITKILKEDPQKDGALNDYPYRCRTVNGSF